VVPETRDPANSEVSELFLGRFAASALVVRDFEKALKYDEKEGFTPIKYGRFKTEFTLRDLVCQYLSPQFPLILTYIS